MKCPHTTKASLVTYMSSIKGFTKTRARQMPIRQLYAIWYSRQAKF